MLKVGDKAPKFSATDDSGNTVTLNDFKGSTIVLYFYPKDMTPGCTQQACDFQSSLAKFKKKKVVIIGVSKDSMEKHQTFKEKYGLKFTLLTDAEGEMCKAFGVWKEKSLYGKKYMGIERTTFVIGANQKIQKIYPKVKVTGHIEAVLADLN